MCARVYVCACVRAYVPALTLLLLLLFSAVIIVVFYEAAVTSTISDPFVSTTTTTTTTAPGTAPIDETDCGTGKPTSRILKGSNTSMCDWPYVAAIRMRSVARSRSVFMCSSHVQRSLGLCRRHSYEVSGQCSSHVQRSLGLCRRHSYKVNGQVKVSLYVQFPCPKVAGPMSPPFV